MKYYHLLGSFISTVLYFIASYAIGDENEVTQAMMKIANTLVDTAETVNEELYANYYEKLSARLETLNDIVFSDIHGDKLNKYKENVGENISNVYKSLLGKDLSLIPIQPELLAHRLYHILKSRMDKSDVANLVLGRLKNVTGTRRDAGDPKAEFQERLSEQLLSELTEDSDFGANTDEKVENPQNYWKGPKTRESADARRLYKATETSIHAYPFMVSVYVANRFWCGGVLYWHDVVLTTASCLQLVHNNRFYRENPRFVSVRIGSNVSLAGGEMVEAAEVYFYPEYNPQTFNHNMALIRLRYWVFFDHSIPKIIKLSKSKNPPSIQTTIMVLAWGAQRVSGLLAGPGELRYQYQPIYPNIICSDIYKKFPFNYRTMFCAGTVNTDGACNHDAGGAAIDNGRLLGLISHGPTACGLSDSPTIFTHIGYYASWIKKINESMPHYYRATVATTITTNATTTTSTMTEPTHKDDSPIVVNPLEPTPEPPLSSPEPTLSTPNLPT